MDETINTIMEKNCTTCTKATERRTATGHTGWHCTLNDIDVNSRMSCEEHSTMTEPPVFATSVASISTEKAVIH